MLFLHNVKWSKSIYIPSCHFW